MNYATTARRINALRILQLQQGLGGVKEVKLLGIEKEFVASYRVHNAESARVGYHQATLQQLPRKWIELLAVAGLATLVVAHRLSTVEHCSRLDCTVWNGAESRQRARPPSFFDTQGRSRKADDFETGPV